MDASSVSNINSTILTTHRMVEAFKYAFARRTELGDPDFVNITSFVNELTSKEYADYIRKQIRDDRTFNEASHYGAVFYNQEDHGTAHISVVSPDGDAVSVTSTINLCFGAGITSKRTGIILNSGMDDFSVPGNVNYFGLQPSPNNFIEPGKMSLS
ncbi:glutathione hydrolase 1 proenzyme-like [Lycorma delicatula]|uniref:glutathione hydrolase 1 proenzyme-like n=1 Tax=Lycorma delicatula TaxID=130591 RepID=UPI003F51A44F